MKKKPKAKPPTGRMEIFIGRVEVTRNGETKVIKDVHVVRKLVNGEWIDVISKGKQ